MNIASALIHKKFSDRAALFFRSAGKDSVPHFFKLHSENSLKGMFEKNAQFYIEHGLIEEYEQSLRRLTAYQPTVGVSITSLSAYRYAIAIHFTKHLAEIFRLTPEREMSIQTCLQEAFVNALVHGNLGIANEYDNASSLDSHYERIEHKLREPDYATKRIEIMAWKKADAIELAVFDYGTGLPSVLHSTQNNTAAHGRGLLIISSLADKMWIGDVPTSLYMRFGEKKINDRHK